MAEHDLYDDDFWRGHNGIMERRQNYFASMTRLDAMSRELTEQAHQEYLDRERRKSTLLPEDEKPSTEF
jgi:hypothetical protein